MGPPSVYHRDSELLWPTRDYFFRYMRRVSWNDPAFK